MAHNSRHAEASNRLAADQAGLCVALVCTQKRWHGGEQQGALLARGLRQRGHRCVILARCGSDFAARMAAEQFEVRCFWGDGRNPVGVWQLRRYLRQIRPDVLHYNDPHAITAAGLASWGLPIGARIAVRHLCFPIRWAFRYRAFCDRVVCVSEPVAEVCRQSGIPAGRVCVVRGGVDAATCFRPDRAHARARLDIPNGQPVILTVAQLVACKGHRFLLEALPGVLGQYPQVQVLLAGDGPLREALQDQSRQLGIERHVHFLGHRRDVPELLAAADLLVLPSLAEALPVTIMEAMLAGCPIVAAAVGGIRELVGDRGCGESAVAWLVPPGDPAALAAALLDALAAPDRRQDRARRARDRALHEFTADRMVEQTLAVYRDVLTAHSAHSSPLTQPLAPPP